MINWLTGQINASNGLVDEAIASFESVLATKIPDRKFDFSSDYRVINDLGAALFARARIELPVTSPARRDYLLKAIAAYRRTLAIDSENVGAHWGLAQAFSDPAWGQGSPTKSPMDSEDAGKFEPTDGDDLLRQANSIVDPKFTVAERRSRAVDLEHKIEWFMAGPRPEYQSRLEPLHDVVTILNPAWDAAVSDPDTLDALAKALKAAHRQLHERLKPDETAEGRAFSLARQRDPAANLNAQSIVIHPLHRKGAPGIDQSATMSGPTHSIETTAAAGQEYHQ